MRPVYDGLEGSEAKFSKDRHQVSNGSSDALDTTDLEQADGPSQGRSTGWRKSRTMTEPKLESMFRPTVQRV